VTLTTALNVWLAVLAALTVLVVLPAVVVLLVRRTRRPDRDGAWFTATVPATGRTLRIWVPAEQFRDGAADALVTLWEQVIGDPLGGQAPPQPGTTPTSVAAVVASLSALPPVERLQLRQITQLLAAMLAVQEARDLARDLAHDLDRAPILGSDLARARVLARALYRGLARARVSALALARTSASASASHRAAAIGLDLSPMVDAVVQDVDRAVARAAVEQMELLTRDMHGADLRALDQRGVAVEELTGVQWSDQTQWPEAWREWISWHSVRIGDQLYEIRPGASSSADSGVGVLS